LTVDSRVLPDTNFEAGYRISGFQKSGSGFKKAGSGYQVSAKAGYRYPSGYPVSEKALYQISGFPLTKYPLSS